MTFEEYLRETKSVSGYTLYTWNQKEEVKFFISEQGSHGAKTLKFIAKGNTVERCDSDA